MQTNDGKSGPNQSAFQTAAEVSAVGILLTLYIMNIFPRRINIFDIHGHSDLDVAYCDVNPMDYAVSAVSSTVL